MSPKCQGKTENLGQRYQARKLIVKICVETHNFQCFSKAGYNSNLILVICRCAKVASEKFIRNESSVLVLGRHLSIFQV